MSGTTREQRFRRVYLQPSNGENGDQSDLLSTSEIQASDDWNRKNDYGEVGYDVDSGIGAATEVSAIDRLGSEESHTTTSRTGQYTLHVPLT
jgi:hypothetical protein